MSTHNIGFYEDLTKIIFQLSSNTHLISSSELFVVLYMYDIHLSLYMQVVDTKLLSVKTMSRQGDKKRAQTYTYIS